MRVQQNIDDARHGAVDLLDKIGAN